MVSRFVLRPARVGDPGTLMAIQTTHDGDVHAARHIDG
jgi:hypothetical protein